MRRECRERFPCHRGLAIPTCITARAWRTCRDACRDRWLVVSFEVGGGKNVPGIPGACATRNFAYLVRGPLKHFLHYWFFVKRIHRSLTDSRHKGPIIWSFHISLLLAWTDWWQQYVGLPVIWDHHVAQVTSLWCITTRDCLCHGKGVLRCSLSLTQ